MNSKLKSLNHCHASPWKTLNKHLPKLKKIYQEQLYRIYQCNTIYYKTIANNDNSNGSSNNKNVNNNYQSDDNNDNKKINNFS